MSETATQPDITLRLIEVQEDERGHLDYEELSIALVSGMPWVIRSAFDNFDDLTEAEQKIVRRLNLDSDEAAERHYSHIRGALLLVEDELIVYEEYPMQNFFEDTVEHFDGLTRKFTQLHTTGWSEEGSAHTKSTLRRYPTHAERHKQLEKLYEERVGESNDVEEWVGPKQTIKSVGESGFDKLTDPSLGTPSVLEVVTRSFDKLEFPNGYDGSPTSDPIQEFNTHQMDSEYSGKFIDRPVALGRVDIAA